VTGAEIEAHVEGLCRSLGVSFRFHVVPPSFGMTRGLVDDIIIGSRGILWREVKGDGDSLRSDQRRLGYALQALGQDWAVWTSEDAASGKIEDELRRIA
jgi:hypothetical protein